MSDDPYGLKQDTTSLRSTPLFAVEWEPDDSFQWLVWRWCDSWRRPALELFTRYTPKACFERMAKVADEINQDPDDFGFEAPLSGHFSQDLFTLQKAPPLLLDRRRLFGGVLSARIERWPKGLYIRVWHRFSAAFLALATGLISLTLGWVFSDLLLNLSYHVVQTVTNWLALFGISLGIWLILFTPLLLLGNRWIRQADSDLLIFTRQVLDDDTNFDGWPSLRLNSKA
jgi:hypothetical protein